MKKIIAIMICVLLPAIFLSGCGAAGSDIRFGTAGEGGTYYSFGNALAELVMDDDDSIVVDTRETAGSAANLRLISEDYLQMALAQTDIINDAYYGTGIFTQSNRLRGYRAVAGLYTEACQIVVRADSDIESVGDLLGRTVSTGEEESGTEKNAEQILLAYGISMDMINAVHADYSEAADKLRNGDVDAFFCTAGASTNIISELADEIDIRLLSLDESTVRRLTDIYGFYTECMIPSGTYKGQNTDVMTVGVRAVLVVSESVSDAIVQKITESLFSHTDELQKYVSTELIADRQEAVKGITIPFHQGAADYYSNFDITVETEE